MKKTKILLFGLILSVLSVGSFSNAYIFQKDDITTITSVVNGMNDVGYFYKKSDSNVCVSFSNFSNCDYNVKFHYKCNPSESYCGKSQSVSEGSSFCDTIKNFMPYGLDYTAIRFVDSTSPDCSFTAKISQKVSFDGLSPNGIGDLTPVITGLTNSINEFIPYVVYVGLGVLGVLVGFFAIKRLLRFVKGSSLSVFSSRRKK